MKQTAKLTYNHIRNTYGEKEGYSEIQEQFLDFFHRIFPSDFDTSGNPSKFQAYFTSESNIEVNSHTRAKELPPILARLVQFQQKDGSWNDLTVINVVIPQEIGLTYGNVPQQATAIALAIIRQHIDYFDFLQDCHDNAYRWLSMSLMVDEDAPSCRSYIAHARDVLVDSIDSISINIGEMLAAKPPDSNEQPNYEANDLNWSNEYQEHDLGVDKTNQDDRTFSESSCRELSLSSSLQVLRDEDAIKDLKMKLNDKKASIISIYIEIEAMVEEIFRCKDKSIKVFHACRTINERYEVFDELTYLLGDGYRPPAFPRTSSTPSSSSSARWKQTGLRGLRPLVVSFFEELHSLAQMRQRLDRAVNPSCDQSSQKLHYRFVWNDQDIVDKVVHW
jgi:hypothetical protein